MNHPKCVAWGEIGLDYHIFPNHSYAPFDLQKKIFTSQMQHALRLRKPIVIHTREAEEDTLYMMKEYIPKDWPVHVHCFTDSKEFAIRLLQEYSHLYIGFTGVITFKTSQSLRDAVSAVPLNRLLLETDGPFMAPEPHRGKTCHPGHVPLIADKIASLHQISVENVYEQIRKNTEDMYGI